MGKYDNEDLSQATDDELREARGVADERERQMRADWPQMAPTLRPEVYEQMIRSQRRSAWEAALGFRIRNRRAIDEEFRD